MIRSVALMGTIVTIHVVEAGRDADRDAHHEAAPAIADSVVRAFEWFSRVEACCTRFDPESELMQLTARIGTAVSVSELLFEAVSFAVAVAEETDGAFDPTIGGEMESRGFNREYRTGRVVRTSVDSRSSASYRDVVLDSRRRTITLTRPLVLDLGAVAKGMAIDLAARELRPHENFAIDAGGDLYLAGCGPGGSPWSVGIRHPRLDRQLIDALRVSNMAVCTSGDYERESPAGIDPALTRNRHILDPQRGAPVDGVASVTVLAPTAMVADALATAAFVLGPAEGIRLLERQGVDGLIVSPGMERFLTEGMRRAAAVADRG
jgi:thiamine biosynthesis lipoprotein